MGFFSGMRFWEKVAFTALSPVVLPAAAVVAAYEKVTEGKPFFDSHLPNSHDETEIPESAGQQAKEKQAKVERKAIVSYAKNGLVALQKSYLTTDIPRPLSFNFTQLREAVQSNRQPLEIFTQLATELAKTNIGLTARMEMRCLNKEVKELEKLRQEILDFKTAQVSR